MIYLDNAATTAMYPELINIIESLATAKNPSSLHKEGVYAKQIIKDARQSISNVLGGKDGVVYFNSSGTEGNNTVLFGVRHRKNSRIIVSECEHSSVYYSAKELLNRGYDVQFVKCNKDGTVNFDNYIKLLTPETTLISIMQVNNETGGVNDIKKLVESAKKVAPKSVFHTDGVQSMGKLKINLKTLGVDCFTFSGHKFRAMKGVGGLWVKNGINLSPLMYGGGQEFSMRPSTENIIGIACMDFALHKFYDEYDQCYIKELADFISNEVISVDEQILVNSNSDIMPNIISFAFPNVRGESILNLLNVQDICISTGSACASNNANSRIPKALGLVQQYEKGLLRVSLSMENTFEEVATFVKLIKEAYISLKLKKC